MTHRWTRRTLLLVGVAVVATALLVGGGVAVAAQAGSDDELAQMADRIRSKDAFETTVAKELGTTAAKLEAAIVAAANARIDAAEKAGSISAADADLLRETVADEPRAALRIAEGATVAKELGTTEAKLDAAWAKAAKQQALARVDDALADGRITKATADELRSRIEQTTFPGFGERGPGRDHHGMGGGGGLFGHGHGHGGAMPFGYGTGGDGPAGGAPSSGSSSSTQPSAVFF
jgi:hypothetical protein